MEELLCHHFRRLLFSTPLHCLPLLTPSHCQLHEYIDDTEDYINIQLELFLSSGTVCLSIYSLVAVIFGMNIPYTWNEHYGFMFKWVVICAGAFCAILFVLIISYARCKGLVGS